MSDPRDAVRALFARTSLASHADALAALARDTLFLDSADVAPERLAPGASRAFGEPDLPPGTAWPHFEQPQDELARRLSPEDLEDHLDRGALVRARDAEGRDVLRARLEFIAQVRLADVAEHDRSGLLPRSGLLSFFLAPELLLDVGGQGPTPGRYLVPCRVLYTEGDLTALRPVAPPADAPPHTRRPPIPLRFSHGLTLPSPDHAAIQALGLPDSVYGPASWEHDGALPVDRMLGYHAGTAEVGLPRPGEVLLFEATHLDWVHAHVMYVCIPEAALAARDFSAAWCVPSLE
jgi:hypothetical protein